MYPKVIKELKDMLASMMWGACRELLENTDFVDVRCKRKTRGLPNANSCSVASHVQPHCNLRHNTYKNHYLASPGDLALTEHNFDQVWLANSVQGITWKLGYGLDDLEEPLFQVQTNWLPHGLHVNINGVEGGWSCIYLLYIVWIWDFFMNLRVWIAIYRTEDCVKV